MAIEKEGRSPKNCIWHQRAVKYSEPNVFPQYILLPSARMHSEGTVVGSVCVSVT